MQPAAPYRLLEHPLIYNISQHITATGFHFLLKKHFQAIFGESCGLVLDVGCGPRLNTPAPQGEVCGVDINLGYLRQYSAAHNRTGVLGSADGIPFKNNVFNESRCFGLLHHLPRETALLTVREMIRCTKAGGRVIILDNVWPRTPYVRPLAWLSRRLDRGRWVRREAELVRLAEEAHAGPWQSSRFTYTFIGQEALALTLRKT